MQATLSPERVSSCAGSKGPLLCALYLGGSSGSMARWCKGPAVSLRKAAAADTAGQNSCTSPRARAASATTSRPVGTKVTAGSTQECIRN